jgi:uncharacterized protein
MPPAVFSLVANVADYAFLSLLILGAVGAACIAYGVFIERRWYRLATYRLPILPPGARPLTVLHLSDLHFAGSDRGKTRFLASLPQPDVTVLTGDLLGEPSAVETATAALGPLRGTVESYFVLGSNDYFAPRPLSYLAYFRRRRRRRRLVTPGRGGDLVSQLEANGWTHLKNRRVKSEAAGLRLDVVGLDDPHIERHDLRVAVGRDPGAFGLAIVHSPDPVPELAALGYDLVVSGHTHGGQVRMPFIGALVTNSSIPTRLCMGLSRFGGTLVHISPGIGTSKFAPFRFLCRPEATLLELTPARQRSNVPVAQDPGTTAEASTRSNTAS